MKTWAKDLDTSGKLWKWPIRHMKKMFNIISYRGKAHIKAIMRCYFIYRLEWLKLRWRVPSTGEDVEHGELSETAFENVKPLENCLAVAKLNKYFSCDPATHSTPRYFPTRNESVCPNKDFYLNVHLNVLVFESWRLMRKSIQLKNSQMFVWWLDKLWLIYTV